ncbi:MAG: glucose-1-phosphate adenylyltransferase [Candidatus Competibacter denitrificans]|jgi:glucose-1-phosphate adenylyltransferase|uniref:Glucose-1-phosphate adenylyltransferase n=1 Tax=Candidatus Competibacter denitrificans Run_A_D11 TaxID=1400863 RepID=W6M9B2_9GAMM|nr:glucose-1-phosphate adenylyltransferase [Candidatus Competibacter denitrificans]CDI02355.1 Glucose-1-phosphate adenylyltransferase [Candidatus Competibacter denitrificans Run_A_D11]HAS87351.1 glucose-1-phosphate adenylyltransferase [Candidatus Competibacteraceae bacterium]HRC69660.1 glucose-1-phosphate adenylyltransferase [Candidatus Competibacter denitrificans]
MKQPKILAFVMAGGEGSRLSPLTSQNSKPSLPFGSRYRIVDFVLSNLLNSGIHSIYMLVQYKSQSLIEHVRKAWVVSPMRNEEFVTVVPPQMMRGGDWFMGTSDAVYQNLNLIQMHNPDLVLVFGADHVYRMDLQQMIDFHREREADVSVAALPVPLVEARGFGVIVADHAGRVSEFQEKPEKPTPMPSDPTRAYASMGNYLFDAKVLVDALKAAAERGEHDFGQNILPRLKETHRLFAYDFATNKVPGVKPYEEQPYWRDVGTLDAYFNAHQDMLAWPPRFDVFNPQWRIFSSNYQGPVARMLDAKLKNSVVAAGSLVHSASVSNTIVRREVIIEDDVEIEDCIIQDYVHIKRGAKLRRAIIGGYNVIEAGTRIGYDPELDGRRYSVTESGITVVGPGEVTTALRAFSE